MDATVFVSHVLQFVVMYRYKRGCACREYNSLYPGGRFQCVCVCVKDNVFPSLLYSAAQAGDYKTSIFAVEAE